MCMCHCNYHFNDYIRTRDKTWRIIPLFIWFMCLELENWSCIRIIREKTRSFVKHLSHPQKFLLPSRHSNLTGCMTYTLNPACLTGLLSTWLTTHINDDSFTEVVVVRNWFKVNNSSERMGGRSIFVLAAEFWQRPEKKPNIYCHKTIVSYSFIYNTISKDI